MEKESIKALVKMLGPIAWIALAAGLQMLGALLFFQAPLDPIIIATIFFITFGIYMLNRFTDKEDSYNFPEQKKYFQEKSKLIILPISLVVFSFVLLAITERLVIWHIVLIGFGILYSISIVPIIRNNSLFFIRFKDMLLVKNISVSILWSATSFAIASCQKHGSMPNKNDLAVVVFAFFIATFINTNSCDVCDEDGDRHAGVLTLATRLGKNATGIFMVIIGIIGCSIIGINLYLNNIGKAVAILFFINIFLAIIVASPAYIKMIKVPKVLLKPMLDSQVFFCGLSLIIFSVYK